MDIAAFINGIRPTERISVAEWADRHRYLAIGSSSMPGRYQTARTPYMRKIMECMSAHLPYKKIVLMKGAQVGATEAASNFIGYAMHVAPAPIMMVQPTEDMVKKISRGRIDTLYLVPFFLLFIVKKTFSYTILQTPHPSHRPCLHRQNLRSGSCCHYGGTAR